MSKATEKVEWDDYIEFSATSTEERNMLGERVTQWIADHPQICTCDYDVKQSVVHGLHQLTITLFFLVVKADELATATTAPMLPPRPPRSRWLS